MDRSWHLPTTTPALCKQWNNQRVTISEPPPPFTAADVEMVCRALGEAVRGHQITSLTSALKVKEDANEQPNTKWKRLFNAVATAQNRQGDGRPLLRLVGEVMQPVRFQSPVEFENHRVEVNERLLLSGYLVREDGKVARVSRATTLSAAQE